MDERPTGIKLRGENLKRTVGHHLAHRAVQLASGSFMMMRRFKGIHANRAHNGRQRHACEPARPANGCEQTGRLPHAAFRRH